MGWVLLLLLFLAPVFSVAFMTGVETWYIRKKAEATLTQRLWPRVLLGNLVCAPWNAWLALVLCFLQVTTFAVDEPDGEAGSYLVLDSLRIVAFVLFVVLAYAVSWRIKAFFVRRWIPDRKVRKLCVRNANRISYLACLGLYVALLLLIFITARLFIHAQA
jgi:hypothetical protein